jgi:hypothetical protein
MYNAFEDAYLDNRAHYPLRTQFYAASIKQGIDPYTYIDKGGMPMAEKWLRTPGTHYVQRPAGNANSATCNTNQHCPLGTRCLDRKCVTEVCQTNGSCSSGICDDDPNNVRNRVNPKTRYNPRNVAKCAKQGCRVDIDCPLRNCMNGPNYKPDDHGNFYCGRPKQNSVWTLFAEVNPFY